MQAEQSMRLSGAQLRLFAAIMLQNKSIFDTVRERLTVDHFEEESYRFLYRVLLDYEAANDCLPSYAELSVELETLLEDDEELISEDGRFELEEFFAYAYDPENFTGCLPESTKAEKFAIKAFQKILTRRLHRMMTVDVQKASIDEIAIFAQRINQGLEEIKYVNAVREGGSMSFPDDWDRTNPKLFRTTGLGFLDKYFGGGTAQGEAYGLMAPYGTCKTTLGVMLWCTTALQSYADYLENEAPDEEKKIGLSVLITYEASKTPEVLHRSIMYAAGVSRFSLDRMGLAGVSSLSDDNENPLPYEKTRFVEQIKHGTFVPERQRVKQIIPILNKHTVCFDFSGADAEFPTAGNGGVDEIVRRLNMELKARGDKNHYIENVIIDYLGIMVDRDNSEKDKSKSKDDHKVYQLAVQQIVNKICKPFKCHGWILHQLSGSANAMLSPTKTLHHTDAKGSKSFAENLDFCFVIGNLNNDAMGQIACTKYRRFRRLPASVIQVDGEFNTVKGMDNYYIDNNGGIIDKSTMTIAGLSPDLINYPDIESTNLNVSQQGDYDVD
jgi:hypothetical protein